MIGASAARHWREGPPPPQVSIPKDTPNDRRRQAAGSSQLPQRRCLPASRLVLEITESVLMGDAEAAITVLRSLKGLGVGLSVDDFGTGSSSLSYLKKFPVDILKIDRSFVDGLGTEREDSAIVRATVTLAHSLGLATVAEGTETPTQLLALSALGCGARLPVLAPAVGGRHHRDPFAPSRPCVLVITVGRGRPGTRT
jgi:EAL domain-containing protein (putative c-di-GMP-specific phosphodiesterase class I)